MAPNPDVTSLRKDLLLLVSAWAGIVGPPLLMIIITIDGYFRPGYSPISQFGSDLGVGWQYAWVQDLNVGVFGILLMLFAVGFYWRTRRLFKRRRLVLVTFLLLIAGLGGVLAGVFTEAVPAGHAVGGITIFNFPPLAQILAGPTLATASGWGRYGRYTRINGGLALAWSLFGTFYPILGLVPPLAPFVNAMMQTTGLNQRIGMILSWNWYVVSGIFFLSRPDGSGPAVTR